MPRSDQATPVSLLEILTETLRLTDAQASSNGVNLAWTIDPGLPPYVCTSQIDLRSFVQVLLNRALSVATDSMLHLTLAASGENRVLLQLEDSGGSDLLSSKNWQQLVFWVEELGGEISRVNEGLLWTVKLPLAQIKVEQVQQKRGQLTASVAIADTDVRAKIVDFLKPDNAILEARNQHELVELCRVNAFDLLVLDADLPGDANEEFNAVLEKAAAQEGFVALLSNTNPFQGDKFWWAHVWLPKPPNFAELSLMLSSARSLQANRQRSKMALARGQRTPSNEPKN